MCHQHLDQEIEPDQKTLRVFFWSPFCTPKRNHSPDFEQNKRQSYIFLNYIKLNHMICDLLCLASFAQYYIYEITLFLALLHPCFTPVSFLSTQF